MSPPVREPGYYWVKIRSWGKTIGPWEVAEYLGDAYDWCPWIRIGTETRFVDEDFAEIGPRLEEPST